jgi:hypothetical protein
MNTNIRRRATLATLIVGALGPRVAHAQTLFGTLSDQDANTGALDQRGLVEIDAKGMALPAWNPATQPRVFKSTTEVSGDEVGGHVYAFLSRGSDVEGQPAWTLHVAGVIAQPPHRRDRIVLAFESATAEAGKQNWIARVDIKPWREAGPTQAPGQHGDLSACKVGCAAQHLGHAFPQSLGVSDAQSYYVNVLTATSPQERSADDLTHDMTPPPDYFSMWLQHASNFNFARDMDKWSYQLNIPLVGKGADSFDTGLPPLANGPLKVFVAHVSQEDSAVSASTMTTIAGFPLEGAVGPWATSGVATRKPSNLWALPPENTWASFCIDGAPTYNVTTGCGRIRLSGSDIGTLAAGGGAASSGWPVPTCGSGATTTPTFLAQPTSTFPGAVSLTAAFSYRAFGLGPVGAVSMGSATATTFAPGKGSIALTGFTTTEQVGCIPPGTTPSTGHPCLFVKLSSSTIPAGALPGVVQRNMKWVHLSMAAEQFAIAPPDADGGDILVKTQVRVVGQGNDQFFAEYPPPAGFPVEASNHATAVLGIRGYKVLATPYSDEEDGEPVMYHAALPYSYAQYQARHDYPDGQVPVFPPASFGGLGSVQFPPADVGAAAAGDFIVVAPPGGQPIQVMTQVLGASAPANAAVSAGGLELGTVLHPFSRQPGNPWIPGEWNAEAAAITGAVSVPGGIIQPRSGTGMLRVFDQCEVSQVLQVIPVNGNRSNATYSVYVNAPIPSSATLRVSAGDGQTSVGTLTNEVFQQTTLQTDPNPSTWERIQTSLTLPPSTRFLQVQLLVGCTPVHSNGVFFDDVEVVLPPVPTLGRSVGPKALLGLVLGLSVLLSARRRRPSLAKA